MAETSGPFDGTDLAEADWELMLAHAINGVTGTPGGSQLFASATGTRGVAITAGSALVRGHWYKSDATVTVTSGSNGASASRIDRAVLRLNRSANTIVQAVIAGTAGSGLPPTPADGGTTTEIPIWRWTIAPSATSVTSITDERPWLGSLVVPCTSTNRPFSAGNGQIGREMDTGRLIVWTGSAWQNVVDDTGWVTLSINGAQAAAWSANTVCRARKINGVVHIRVALKRWSTSGLSTSDSDGSIPLIVPAQFRPTVTEFGSGSQVRSPVFMQVETSGNLRLFPLVDDVPADRTVLGTATYMI